MNEETKRFILEHEQDDIYLLSLQSSRYKKIDFDFAIRQIVGRQKIRNKVPLFFQTLEIQYPVQLSLEQSSSEITAKYKSTLCEGDSLADLTGGFGVDCCFMSSHFKNVTYIERQTELCKLAIHNFQMLNRNHIVVVNAQTEKFLTEMKPVDWIFIDPARRSKSGKKVVLLSDCEPDVTALSVQLLNKACNVMIKLSPMMDITAAIRDLPKTTEIHIISVENECKEVLLILKENNENKLQVKTINFCKNKKDQQFEFYINDEVKANSILTSEIQKYLYEPNAAIMKSGAFKLIGDRFNLLKLHINTHLYTSNELIIDFPGRVFETKVIWGNSKMEMKNHILRLKKANLTTRNYPMSVDELRKKIRIEEGGNTYLFACTLVNEQKVIIECNKIS
jgi:16S rRNA G966 N2-methylase RsmD